MSFFGELSRLSIRLFIGISAMFLLSLSVGVVRQVWSGEVDTEQAVVAGDQVRAADAFREASLLPVDIAACVVGEIYARTGDHYPDGSSPAWLDDNPQVLNLCTEAPGCPKPANSLAGSSGARFSQQFTFEPGRSAQGTIRFDGTDIRYIVTTPVGFVPKDTAPVLLALPARGELLGETEDLARDFYSLAADRGWVVVSPLSLGGDGFDDAIGAYVPALVEWINGWVTPEGNGPHLVGQGNSGVQAFDVAAAHPGAFSSVTVHPGFMRSGQTEAALQALCSLPVRIWMGGQDEWLTAAQRTETEITSRGGDVRLLVLDGAGHVALAGTGDQFFVQLDEARAG